MRLNTKFVALTAGLVKSRMLIWSGKSKKAPEMPAIDVKNEMTRAATGGNQIAISISAPSPIC